MSKLIILAGSPPRPPTSRNWNPGNYIAETSYDTNTLWGQITSRLSPVNDPDGHWVGVLIRKPWDQLETAEGVYGGLDDIATRLGQIAALAGRKLIVFIQVKTFNTLNSSGEVTTRRHAVPEYMRLSSLYADPDGYTNDLGEYGEYAYLSANGGPGGYVPNMHVAAVRARWDALIAAFAASFNSSPYLEAVALSEASISQPYQVTGTWSRQAEWYAGMLSSFSAMKTSLPDIQICQWINAPRSVMSTQATYTSPRTGWVPDVSATGIGLGMTDLCINDKSFQYVPPSTPGGVYFSTHPGNIFLCQNEGQGNGIVIGHASAETYRGSVATESQTDPYVYPGPQQTRQETRDFATNTVGCTHTVWAHNTSVDPYYVGMTMSEATDAWIHDPDSIISTVTTRPNGW